MKSLKKFEIEMLITFVDRNHNDNGHVQPPQFALLCSQSATEIGPHTSVFSSSYQCTSWQTQFKTLLTNLIGFVNPTCSSGGIGG